MWLYFFMHSCWIQWSLFKNFKIHYQTLLYYNRCRKCQDKYPQSSHWWGYGRKFYWRTSHGRFREDRIWKQLCSVMWKRFLCHYSHFALFLRKGQRISGHCGKHRSNSHCSWLPDSRLFCGSNQSFAAYYRSTACQPCER